jgi:prepilin-type N-terminal cleavage/methylation domain-containing protein
MKINSTSRNNKGFTLAETLISIMVLGILAAIAAPSFITWYENRKIDNVLTDLEGAIREAQSTSIRRSQACLVTITSDDITAAPANCLPTGTREISPTGSNRNIAVAVTTNTVSFSPDGTTLNTEPFVVYRADNANNPGKMKCLVISSGLGIVRTGKYDDTQPPTIPASLGPAPTLSDPPTAAQAAAKATWDAQADARNTAIRTVASKCIS